MGIFFVGFGVSARAEGEACVPCKANLYRNSIQMKTIYLIRSRQPSQAHRPERNYELEVADLAGWR